MLKHQVTNQIGLGTEWADNPDSACILLPKHEAFNFMYDGPCFILVGRAACSRPDYLTMYIKPAYRRAFVSKETKAFIVSSH